MFSLLTTAGIADSSGETSIGQAVSKVNVFQRFWNGVDQDAVLTVFIQRNLYPIFLIVLFWILHRVRKYLIDKSFNQYSRKAIPNESRSRTLHSLLNIIFYYTLDFFFIYVTLSATGVPIGSLLAGTGIADMAVGLDAQGSMSDVTAGFFIITGQQIDVGDYIKLANSTVEGAIVSVGIRTLQLKAMDGTIHFILNRDITTVSNLSRVNMQVFLDIRVVPGEGCDKIYEIIDRVDCTLAEKCQEELQAEPPIFELVDLGNSNFAIRMVCYVLNGKQYALKEEFLSLYVKELTASGFTIPSNPVAVGK